MVSSEMMLGQFNELLIATIKKKFFFLLIVELKASLALSTAKRLKL